MKDRDQSRFAHRRSGRRSRGGADKVAPVAVVEAVEAGEAGEVVDAVDDVDAVEVMVGAPPGAILPVTCLAGVSSALYDLSIAVKLSTKAPAALLSR